MTQIMLSGASIGKKEKPGFNANASWLLDFGLNEPIPIPTILQCYN